MSYLFDGIDDFLERTAAVRSNTPVTLAGWMKIGALPTTSPFNLITIGVNGSTDNRQTLQIRASAQGNFAAALSRTASSAVADTTAVPATGAWVHAAAVFATTSDRRVFLDGRWKGTDTAARDPVGENRCRIGINLDGSDPVGGRLAEFAVWGVALTDLEVAQLAVPGTQPDTVNTNNVSAYWPLRDHADDLSGSGHNLTVNGPTLDPDHPWPPRAAPGLTTVAAPVMLA